MTVRKEPRRGAVILFASMFIAGNLYSSAGGAACLPANQGGRMYQAAPSERDNDPCGEIFSARGKKHPVRKRLHGLAATGERFG
ncbi:hypothetical protein ACFFYR_28175 [Paraburkholderia dipogonis]|uniref:hypothetical protein n=1 Tax=Paraburkholderia dipogonis TaxID=1211383 RepID=UPI00141B7968|nr:hypothetical protein [Paraburkholderia dipogonis]